MKNRLFILDKRLHNTVAWRQQRVNAPVGWLATCGVCAIVRPLGISMVCLIVRDAATDDFVIVVGGHQEQLTDPGLDARVVRTTVCSD